MTIFPDLPFSCQVYSSNDRKHSTQHNENSEPHLWQNSMLLRCGNWRGHLDGASKSWCQCWCNTNLRSPSRINCYIGDRCPHSRWGSNHLRKGATVYDFTNMKIMNPTVPHLNKGTGITWGLTFLKTFDNTDIQQLQSIKCNFQNSFVVLVF